MVNLSLATAVRLELCDAAGCQAEADPLAPRRAADLAFERGEVRVSTEAGVPLGSVTLADLVFRGDPLAVVHQRSGVPTLSWFALAAATPDAPATVRLIHLAEGHGALTVEEHHEGVSARLATGLALGSATERLALRSGQAELRVDEDGDGVPEQRLALRSDGGPLDVFVTAVDEGLVLADAVGGFGVGWTQPGQDCATSYCTADALCLLNAGVGPACAPLGCGGCAAPDACVEVLAGVSACVPVATVEASGSFDLVLEEDPQTGTASLVLTIGGVPMTLDQAPDVRFTSEFHGLVGWFNTTTVSVRGPEARAVVTVTRQGQCPTSGVHGARLEAWREPSGRAIASVSGTVELSRVGRQAGGHVTGTFTGAGPAQTVLYFP